MFIKYGMLYRYPARNVDAVYSREIISLLIINHQMKCLHNLNARRAQSERGRSNKD